MSRRTLLSLAAGALAPLTAACSPLTLMETLAPRDRGARRIATDLGLIAEFDHEAPAHVTGPPRDRAPHGGGGQGGGHRGQGQGGQKRGRNGGGGKNRNRSNERQGSGRGRSASEARDGSNGNRPKARPNASGTATGNVASSRPPRKRRSRV